MKRRKDGARIVELNAQELQGVLERAKGALDEKDFHLLEDLAKAYAYVRQLVEDKKTTIGRLRRLLFGPRTESTRGVLDEGADQVQGASSAHDEQGGSPAGKGGKEPGEKRRGHGRNGARTYTGAQKIEVAHESLVSGGRCPVSGCDGKVYCCREPGVIVRIRGQAPLAATTWQLEKLRCNLCGEVFTAKAPEGVGAEKYDPESRAMVALLRYGSGLPFNRLEKLEGNLGVPLPASTQWDMVEQCARKLEPVYAELIRGAAQGKVLHNDDTPMRILELGDLRKAGTAVEAEQELFEGRTGVFTSGIVSIGTGHRVALFFTGRRHAGENLSRVLEKRAAELGPPIQMCDALARNVPREAPSVLANCLAHGRRRFVELLESFPAECRTVLESLRSVYRNNAIAKKRSLSDQERLSFHQKESRPVMEALKGWIDGQFKNRTVEPNSGLGDAFQYLLNHWEKLTLFLREPGAPLDNNVCEQALKNAIRHRKNSLFYKTEYGAQVGDLFMSLIQSCDLNEVNAFDYLTQLQKHAAEIKRVPADWMPWNYRDTLRLMQGAGHAPSGP
jgi:transposase